MSCPFAFQDKDQKSRSESSHDSPSTPSSPPSSCPFASFAHPKRRDLPNERAKPALFRFGALGVCHALFGASAFVLVWLEFFRLLVTGFSLDSSVQSLLHSQSDAQFSSHQIIAAVWIFSALLCTLTALPMPFQGFVFSTPKLGDSASRQKRYNWGRAVASLQYPYLAFRAVFLPGGGLWLRLLDSAVALFMLYPFGVILSTYSHTVRAYCEWILLVQMAVWGGESSPVSDGRNRVFLYFNGMLWTKMVLDGFLGYTLYVKGFHSIERVRKEVTLASSVDVSVFLLIFFRAALEKGVGGVRGGLAGVFVLQASYRALNLGVAPLKLYRAGGWVQTVHSSLWVVWAFSLGADGREALLWTVVSLVSFVAVAWEAGDSVVVSAVTEGGARLVSLVLRLRGKNEEREGARREGNEEGEEKKEVLSCSFSSFQNATAEVPCVVERERERKKELEVKEKRDPQVAALKPLKRRDRRAYSGRT
uniref:Transmembrane protein n=1 Tax=Chromera velia CCMP2878 TaxID=1169474 RepID=A0A0G4H5A3_9ALVE|eukprot:Cvel_24740.t1-p1 / transcript=Cvel_24740.t1 / gene=Cvel_24740 / organism=Chromera_velia_CCMP2878 / gene_product=hypothetical protein / transcript_product=hypothetical protein / location=Cvel_scaffold2717:5817-7635(-) / protein_length=476 / sequence_SO=supercontig / SO=protein_coding / is_pseudo=false